MGGTSTRYSHYFVTSPLYSRSIPSNRGLLVVLDILCYVEGQKGIREVGKGSWKKQEVGKF